jgi:hypothetical protein
VQLYPRAERVFVLEHYFASKSFAAVREAFSNAYPDKKVPNKTTIHRAFTEFRDTGSVCDKCSSSDKTVPSDFKQCITEIRLQEFNIVIGFVA